MRVEVASRVTFIDPDFFLSFRVELNYSGVLMALIGIRAVGKEDYITVVEHLAIMLAAPTEISFFPFYRFGFPINDGNCINVAQANQDITIGQRKGSVEPGKYSKPGHRIYGVFFKVHAVGGPLPNRITVRVHLPNIIIVQSIFRERRRTAASHQSSSVFGHFFPTGI